MDLKARYQLRLMSTSPWRGFPMPISKPYSAGSGP